jgi:hypothetical protein
LFEEVEMNKEMIKKAIKEADEFLDRAEICIRPGVDTSGTRDTAALKRQSLELTRALADMRKAN